MIDSNRRTILKRLPGFAAMSASSGALASLWARRPAPHMTTEVHRHTGKIWVAGMTSGNPWIATERLLKDGHPSRELAALILLGESIRGSTIIGEAGELIPKSHLRQLRDLSWVASDINGEDQVLLLADLACSEASEYLEPFVEEVKSREIELACAVMYPWEVAGQHFRPSRYPGHLGMLRYLDATAERLVVHQASYSEKFIRLLYSESIPDGLFWTDEMERSLSRWHQEGQDHMTWAARTALEQMNEAGFSEFPV